MSNQTGLGQSQNTTNKEQENSQALMNALGQVNSESAETRSEHKLFLSIPASILLMDIVERGNIDAVTFTNGMSEEQAQLADQFLAELLDLKFVQLSKIGTTVTATPQGLQAVDRRVGLVYPFGANGTIHDYNSTLLTMSTNAMNAFLAALERTGRAVFNNVGIHRRRLGGVMLMFDDIDVWRRLPEDVNTSIYTSLRGSMEYYTRKKPTRTSKAIIEENLCFWEGLLSEILLSNLKDLGTFKPPKEVKFDHLAVSEISEDGSVVFKDIHTGEESSGTIQDLPNSAMIDVLGQLG